MESGKLNTHDDVRTARSNLLDPSLPSYERNNLPALDDPNEEKPPAPPRNEVSSRTSTPLSGRPRRSSDFAQHKTPPASTPQHLIRDRSDTFYEHLSPQVPDAKKIHRGGKLMGRGLFGAGMTSINLRDAEGTGTASDLKYKRIGSKFIRIKDYMRID